MSHYPSETSKYRHLTRVHCFRGDGEPGCGIDLASQGDPVVPWAWQLDLPEDQFLHYNDNNPIRSPVNLRGDAFARFVEPGSLDFVYSSHLLEDKPLEEWESILKRWREALKPGGRLIVLCPERQLWGDAIKAGQCPNCAHRYEPLLGDLSKAAEAAGFFTLIERLTDVFPGDYSILYVGMNP